MATTIHFFREIILNSYLFGWIIFTMIGCNERNELPPTLPFFNTPNLKPEWIEKRSIKYDNIHRIEKFSFLNQDGKRVTNQNFEDRIYIASFFFSTCPGICPLMTSNLVKLQEAIKEDHHVLLLSHTVTPLKDTVPVLKNYAQSHGILSKKWHLVTGKRKEIYNLARNSYFADEDEGTNNFLHSENLFLIDKLKRIRGVYNSTQRMDIKRLIEDIEVLKSES